jgi:hypothetical protein
MEPESDWWTDYRNIIRLTRWMADHGGWDAGDIAYAVEKPWKYTDEFRLAQKEAEEDAAR